MNALLFGTVHCAVLLGACDDSGAGGSVDAVPPAQNGGSPSVQAPDPSATVTDEPFKGVGGKTSGPPEADAGNMGEGIDAGFVQPVEVPKPLSWKPRTSLPSARSEFSAAVQGGKIYVAGGFGDTSSFDAYLPETDDWQRLTPMPQGRDHASITAFGEFIYVFGGSGATTAWRYEPALDEWQTQNDLPFARSAAVAVALGERIYLVGGAGPSATRLLGYLPQADTWQPLADLSVARDHSAAVALKGELYSLGGRLSSNQFHDSVEIYNPEKDSWRSGPPMTTVRSGFGAVVYRDYIVVCGGEVLIDGEGVALDSCEALAPGADAWELWPSLPQGTHGIAIANYEDRVFVIGGSLQFFSAVNTDQVYELSFQSPDL